MKMEPKYQIGQKVVIQPVKNQDLSPRDSALEPYESQIGEVTDYYWIDNDRSTEVFFIYTVRIGDSHKEIVLHEDELKPCR
jgi:hypothetical protein